MTEIIVRLADTKNGPRDRLLELTGKMEDVFQTLKALETSGIISTWTRNPTRITGEPNPFDDEAVA